ncbi:23S rRNA (pseudouridine(1915)-N(3))-methyltransferase RlmH [Methanogenium marinum]|uniref:Putative ribosomal RNA large subunit methyltransferase H n=1 Tax=Methanogenium marinum TaxID=348610 RepID=A0A9Q4PXR5_9EURY|nr:23S rRNA (pseudouridine(1915)-N(3))-methyltransferase RlmH [Methanogenium marinum]MDE4908951.1 23S rRNA (pseudouridine(1915)-N(3))-methyltransferase RlmH [Methanogenium marinum]
MVRFHVIAVGKVKEPFYRNGVAEYTRRLTGMAEFIVTEVADERLPDNAGAADRARILSKEGSRVLSHVRPQDLCIVLDVGGKLMTSEAFAQYLKGAILEGNSRITVVIGGSLGIAPEVRSRADLLLSFGFMTFPHQMARLILAEQIYRAAMINAGRQYHR